MIDRLFLFLGTATAAAGMSIQSLTMSSAAGGRPSSFGLILAGLVCSAVSAGCLACSPSVRGVATGGQVTPSKGTTP